MGERGGWIMRFMVLCFTIFNAAWDILDGVLLHRLITKVPLSAVIEKVETMFTVTSSKVLWQKFNYTIIKHKLPLRTFLQSHIKAEEKQRKFIGQQYLAILILFPYRALKKKKKAKRQKPHHKISFFPRNFSFSTNMHEKNSSFSSPCPLKRAFVAMERTPRSKKFFAKLSRKLFCSFFFSALCKKLWKSFFFSFNFVRSLA